MMTQRADLCDVTENIPVTFHAYGNKKLKIDYIYLSSSLADKLCSVEIWDDEQAGIYLSDHYPICAELEI